MKKILFHFISAMLILAGCNSINEVYDELDEKDPGVLKDLSYTLVEEDYDMLDKAFGNFDDDDEAKDLVPTILDMRFPQLGLSSSVNVTYDIYDPIRINNTDAYTLNSADYEAIGEGSDEELDNESDLYKAASYLWPNAEEQDLMTMTYTWRDESTRTTKMAFFEGAWYDSYEPTDEDYEFMGEGRFNSFSSRTTARERIAVLFDNLFPFNDAGDYRVSVFQYFNGSSTGDFMAVFRFNGENWDAIQDVVTNSLSFSKTEDSWAPDNTIKYKFGTSDYNWIVDNYSDTYPGGTGNMAQFGNFSGFSWTNEEIDDVVIARLEFLFTPEAVQDFLVTYSIYRDPTRDETVRYNHDNGTWSVVSSNRPAE